MRRFSAMLKSFVKSVRKCGMHYLWSEISPYYLFGIRHPSYQWTPTEIIKWYIVNYIITAYVWSVVITCMWYLARI